MQDLVVGFKYVIDSQEHKLVGLAHVLPCKQQLFHRLSCEAKLFSVNNKIWVDISMLSSLRFCHILNQTGHYTQYNTLASNFQNT